MFVKVEVRCNLSLNTKCSCREGGRERGCRQPAPVPDWPVDKEEGGVVHGGGGKQEWRESSLKRQAIPACGAVSIGSAYCLTHPSPLPCNVSIGQTT